MTKKRRILSIAAALAVVAVAASAIWWFTRPFWPEFPAANGKEPQAITKVERDYAHHIGDLIEVDLFVKQEPGTTVDPKTLSIGGDFELAEQPAVKIKELQDGSAIYRIRLHVQTFVVKPEQVMQGSIGWRAGDKRNDLVIKPLSLFWSNTYDGRENLMEGDNPRVPAFWYFGRHVVPLAISSIVFLVLLAVALVRYMRSLRKEKVVDQARARTAELLRLVKAGTCTKAQHLELDGLVRARYKVGPIPASQLEGRMIEPFVVKFLKENEPAVYAEDALDADSQSRLFNLGDLVLRAWK